MLTAVTSSHLLSLGLPVFVGLLIVHLSTVYGAMGWKRINAFSLGSSVFCYLLLCSPI